mmetsp:Transcript_20768/g.15277  ORF Transcript_20768/g.15277 Transcript_20768/m.15277 type:complete len:103 (-) Transcript_20768:130-438(-)
MLPQLPIHTLVLPKPHPAAVLNDGVALGEEEEVGVGGVVDADLLGTEVDVAVGGLANETGAAYYAALEFAVLHALHVQGFHLHRQRYHAVLDIIYDNIFLAQ